MASDSLSQRKAQLDKEEREHLEDVVTEMRERVEDNVEFQLTQKGLDDEPEDIDSLDEDTQQLVEAIELEAVDGETWSEAFDQYVTGVGYTIVNRLAALRCMEVRGFIDEEVTVFKDNGLTPAAETLVHEEFLLEDEAILEAYHNACDDFAEEIEILFDRLSPYSLIDPDDDTFEELCGMLDSVDDEVWRADDVLGWVYEYYNVKLLDDLRRKGDREGLDPEDVPPANQFYTPHWVVRMLTDNSLGKLYLEHTGELQEVVDAQDSLAPEERKNRPLSPDESPDIADFCTYLVPSEEAGEPTDFDHPRELRVIDPACGSGHFLLYAFDVLERIWRIETDLPSEQIPRKILQHNLYGVDLDMRACQLAAFNLYLKGRTRAEAEGADGFDMPEVGIVCADASIAEIEGVEAVFDEVAGDDPEVKQALERILDAFEEVHGLGSLLDVRGTLGDLFEDDADIGGTQLTLGDDPRESHTLGQVLHSLREAVEEHREGDSFLAQDLRSFVRLLDILAQDYDVSLMNPPYGSRNRMPESVKGYIRDHYDYPAEFYVNFYEVCDRMTSDGGRIGMLVPQSFMLKSKFREFRADFINGKNSFDFLAEFGLGILDNATVRTAATVTRSGIRQSQPTGYFLRLHDLASSEKEDVFRDLISGEESDVKRRFEVPLEEFADIPGHTICYSTPSEVRELHNSDLKLDAEQANIDGESVGMARQGVATADNDRFLRFHWESSALNEFKPIASGGSNAWVAPRIAETVEWGKDGERIKRSSPTIRTPNESLYGKEGLTWTRVKKTGRRFGFYPGGLFSDTGYLFVPKEGYSPWALMSVVNSTLYHALFLSLSTERNWNSGDVGRIPWFETFEENRELGEKAKRQYEIMVETYHSDPTSPYYVGPEILPSETLDEFFHDHPHTSEVINGISTNYGRSDPSESITTLSREAEQRKLSRTGELLEKFQRINTLVYDELGIPDQTRQEILDEVFLRTLEGPEDRKIPDPDSIPEVPENLDEQVKDLVHHFAMEAVRDEDDGIVPIHGVDNQPNMLDRIVERFEDAYGEHAEDRLVEVDGILGAESAAEEAYPNLRGFIEDDLFDYHVSRMENTPIVWKLTTERLLADSTGEGFACFLDYHSLDSGLFDRLSNQYLEPRKAELREQRSAANRRRSDDSLSASEQAKAAEQYERCASGLDQIAVFEDVVQDLGSVDEREFDEANRALVENLAPKVAAFREETRERIDTLAELHERKDPAWFKDTFSEKFWETVDEWRDEWLDALAELEGACEAYAKPTDEPVEAHLADLFDYFNWRLKGSDHYSSSGILFMTYYFGREGSNLLDENGQPHDHLSEDERRLASLAMGLDDVSIVDEEYLEAVADDETVDDIENLPPLAEFKALAEEIDDRCQTIDKRVPSDWADRALSEITTAGYQPNHKHGVEINITPLADAEIVPKTVDDDVL
ncbi:BREX-5 system adenine-specific DNA-methyltransferase PglX [Haloarcula japonica]|uniref:BREX-5 system adenine-specific DNA-methyltransferase PglX n=1 Tax=Halobacteriales TaxID=2235 RepID=UPI001F314EF6|nr:BREX-5 system adenine-specific DNA-methyltransferase PglX [Halobacterium salinarum]MCF2206453.1 BREX-5 system adenine-specific DNA-methyltransferase PglX [Halobacterium salinarum]MCF2240292.1 BREX-5 system adenine-specific DNA-methyltransferase PglX [Halobacterium salinarum]